jgi:hypothetical protein
MSRHGGVCLYRPRGTRLGMRVKGGERGAVWLGPGLESSAGAAQGRG